jgi:transcriptional regulator with XRE-family HTH domain
MPRAIKIDPRTLGGRLRRARNKAGLTAAELGQRAGMTGSSVVMIERNERDPNTSTLRRLAQALEVQPSTLLG